MTGVDNVNTRGYCKDMATDPDAPTDPKSPTASHVTVTAYGAAGFQSGCQCGWRSDTFTTRAAALTAARVHRANMTVQAL